MNENRRRARRVSPPIVVPLRRHHAILLLAFSCTSSRAAEKVTYDDHVLPVFQQSCLNCHNPDKAKGGLDLSTYSGSMKGGSGGRIAEPGDPSSKLIAVVTHAAEPVMPPEGDKLGAREIDILRAWVEGGLLETKDSQAKKPSKPRFDSAMRTDPTARPDGPPPLPHEPLLEPVVVGERPGSIHAMAVSPWAPLLAVTGQRQILLYRTDTLEPAGILPFPEGEPYSLAFTPDGRYLIAGGGVPGKSGFTITFDVVTGTQALNAGREFDSVLCADLRPDLGEVATGSPSKLVKFWQAADGSQRASIKKHTDWVTELDYSPDGILLATGDRNGGVWVWEAASGNEFHTLRAHQAGITGLAFRADSNLLASASADGTVRFWEMNNGSEVRKLDAHGPGVMAFAWGEGGRFATAGRDKTAKWWKPDFNLEREIKGLADIPTAIAISPDGKRLFIATYDGTIAVHNTDTGEKTASLDANPPAIATRLAALTGEIEAAREAASAADAAMRKSTAVLETAEAASRDAAAAHDAARKALEDHTRAHQEAAARAAEFQSKLQQVRSKVAALEASHREARQPLAALEKELAGKRQEVEAATKAHEAATRARTEAGATPDGPEKAARITAAETALHEAARSLESARAGMTETEARLRATREVAATREADLLAARQDPLLTDPAGPLLANAVESARAAMENARKAVPAAGKAAAEAVKGLETVRNEHEKVARNRDAAASRIQQLLHDQRRWLRASWNSRAIQLSAEAAALEQEIQRAMDHFSATAAEIGALARKLASQREELEQARTGSGASASSRIADLEKSIASLMTEWTGLRRVLGEARLTIDSRSPVLQALRHEATQLKSRYRAAGGTGT